MDRLKEYFDWLIHTENFYIGVIILFMFLLVVAANSLMKWRFGSETDRRSKKIF